MREPDRDEQRAQALGDVLMGVSRELDLLWTKLDTLHFFLENLAATSEGERPKLIEAGQAVDVIEQTLAVLARYLASVASAVPPCAVVDARRATRQISLAAVAARLSGEGSADAPPGPGDFESF